nr:MAG TPA: hypothetical protein [Caudoviricetes sp.]
MTQLLYLLIWLGQLSSTSRWPKTSNRSLL